MSFFYNFAPLRLGVLALIFSSFAHPQTLAPGSPGKDAQWSSAGKQGVGTSATLESKVWFTLEGGALTEVYYPDVTAANVHLLQFIVVNKKTGKIETEKDDTIQQIDLLDANSVPSGPANSLAFYQTNRAKDGKWRIRKKYITDPERNTVLIDFEFSQYLPPVNTDWFEVYVYYDPSINNSGMHDTAWTQDGVLAASDGDKASALACETGFEKITNGFLGTSDGLTQLRSKKEFQSFERAENGNVVQVAKVNLERNNLTDTFRSYAHAEFALSFGKTSDEAVQTAKASLRKGFKKSFSEYEKGWSDYLKTLPRVEPKYQAQLNVAAMILKAHEDKTHEGANIASLTVPWGGGDNANENNVGGYHLVWSRDLYQVATAFMALGDKAAAERALDFVFRVQQKPDGSVPQNSWLDGKPFWTSLQLDEVAFPLILAYQLGRSDKVTYENHIKKAADFIVKNGPVTPQERWEERSGYSPSTIAAEIAGLVCAAEIAQRNGDAESANRWLKTADEWRSNIEEWTSTTTGKYGDGHYYLRITQKGNPNAGDKIDLGNGAGTFDERDIVDAGFLELVRLGIKPADDPLIVKSLKVIDQVIRVGTPHGDGFYRYSHDGYGEMDDGRRWNFDGKYTGKGRLWALLSGERGQYELALSNAENLKIDRKRHPLNKSNQYYRAMAEERKIANGFKTKANARLDAMLGFANEGLMIPEQIWDSPQIPPNIDKQFVPELKFGEGTGSATPLAWSMAQFIRLAANLQAGRNLDTPDIVYNRYVLGIRSGETELVQSPGKIGTLINMNLIKDLPIRSIPDLLKFPETHNPLFVEMRNPAFRGCDNACKDKEKEIQACFVYDKAFKTFEIAGDFTGWKPQKFNIVQHIESGGRISCLIFPKTARVEYKFIVDGQWITDPLNPNKVDNGVGGENSFFVTPDYRPTEWDKGETPPLEILEVDSKVYGEKRKIQVFRSPLMEFRPVFLPVLYVQDGSDYINRVRAVQIQQNLISAGKVEPFMTVFIDYKDRMKEYWANDDYAKFLAEEVVPVIDAKYKTIKNRDGRALLGASLGGVTSIHTALKYPAVFGRVGGQSSSFWIDNQRVIKELEALDGKTKFQFYLDAGMLEGTADTRRAVEILRKKGFDVSYREAGTGHNWTAWRDRLADAFIALWK